jgi:alpha-beta hydrolase superfamily lysophospholipase
MGEHTFTDSDGVEIFYRSWPVEAAKGVVVISHGASEHSARYGRFAEALNAAGYAAYAIDHRAHGRTAASSGNGKMGPGDDQPLLRDLRELEEIARTEVPGVPVVLFGHSMGSMIAQGYVQRFGGGLAGYVLSGCPGPMDGIDDVRAAVHGAVEGGMADEALDMLGPMNEPFEPARTKFDWLSRDAAEVDKYIADPLCGDGMPLTFGFVDGLLDISAPAMEADGIAKTPHIPLLMITGEMDSASGMAANARELETRIRAAGLDVTSHYYPEARHEILNETNRDEVTADVVTWLDAVVAAAT